MKITLVSLIAATALLAGCMEPPAPAAEEVIVLETAPAPSVEEVLAIE